MKLHHLLTWLLPLTLLAGSQTLTDTQAPPTALRLAALFGDRMVLQREMETPVWGWAPPGAHVRVTRNTEAPLTTQADTQGAWKLLLPPLPAGGPHTLTIATDQESIILNEVMMGDVWICSGQSNMQWPVWVRSGKQALYTQYPVEESALAVYPDIRLFTVPMTTSFQPQTAMPTAKAPMYPGDSIDNLSIWRICSPESVQPFSAVGYFFGRALRRDLKIPIGLIQTAWGGTPCEAWTSADALTKHPDYRQPLHTLHQDLKQLPLVQRRYEANLAAFEEKVLQADPGYVDGAAAWAQPSLNEADWQAIELPNLWETEGYPDLDGYVWFRHTIQLPETWQGDDLILRLTAINDANETWFNGVKIADFTDQAGVATPRRYLIPAALAQAGRNQITVRVYDMGNKGGFIRSTGEMELENPEEDTAPLPLAGMWKMRIGVELRALPPRPIKPLALGGDQNTPTVLFNAMIAPLMPFGIKGAIWYQGESNVGRAAQYRTLFPAMISDWRRQWGQGDFPFLFVQLANYLEEKNQPVESAWAELREAQLLSLALPNTGMAVTIDIGDANDIHPKNKQEVGRRLALAARHLVTQEDLVYSGPLYTAMQIEGDRIRLYFDHTAEGLVARGGPLTGFAIAGADGHFVWAQAYIEKDTVVVHAPGVSKPTAVRYAWADNPFCNFFNSAGLPASPFRTDAPRKN